MWTYFYFEHCPSCQLWDQFIRSISGTYNITFNDVLNDGWFYANSCGVTRVPSLYNGSGVFVMGLLTQDEVINILTT